MITFQSLLKAKTAILVMISIFLVSSASWAATYYVDATNGNDNNHGLSSSKAWRTIARVNSSSFQPGDQILFERGEVWSEQLTIPSSGSSGSPIIFGAYGSGAKPVISGADKRGFGIWIANKSHIIVEDFKIEKAKKNGLDIFATSEGMNAIIIRNIVSSRNNFSGLRSTGMNDHTIKNVIIEDSVFNYNGGNGIFITSNSDNFTIRNNTVHNNCILDNDIGDNENGWGEHDWTGGIRGGTLSSNNLIIEDNVVYSNGKLNGSPVDSKTSSGFGIWFDTLGTGGIIRRNIVYDNRESGIRLEATSGAEVYYNISYGNDKAGISVARNVHDNKIYNNVSYNNKNGIKLNGDPPSLAGNCTENIVKNNIAVNNSNLQFQAWWGCENDGTYGYNNVYENNCFGVETDNFVVYGYAVFKDTYDAWETAYGGSTHSVESDPLFTDPNNFQFTLQSGSPAIDAGVNVGLTQDFNKNPVPHFGVDMGAFEYQGAPGESYVVPQSLLSIVSVDSEEFTGVNGAAENAIDGWGGSHWHTEWYYSDPKHPHEIIINLGDIYNVKGFRYLPRQVRGTNGTVADYTFYVSNDGVSWGQPVAAGTFNADAAEKEVTFSGKIGQFIRFVALSEIDGQPWTSMAEINILGSDVD